MSAYCNVPSCVGLVFTFILIILYLSIFFNIQCKRYEQKYYSSSGFISVRTQWDCWGLYTYDTDTWHSQTCMAFHIVSLLFGVGAVVVWGFILGECCDNKCGRVLVFMITLLCLGFCSGFIGVWTYAYQRDYTAAILSVGWVAFGLALGAFCCALILVTCWPDKPDRNSTLIVEPEATRVIPVYPVQVTPTYYPHNNHTSQTHHHIYVNPDPYPYNYYNTDRAYNNCTDQPYYYRDYELNAKNDHGLQAGSQLPPYA